MRVIFFVQLHLNVPSLISQICYCLYIQAYIHIYIDTYITILVVDFGTFAPYEFPFSEFLFDFWLITVQKKNEFVSRTFFFRVHVVFKF